MKFLPSGFGILTLIPLLFIAALLGFTGGHVRAAQSPHLTQVSIVPGALHLSTTAYSPDVVTVVIGVNNSVVWTNNDDVTHTATGTNTTFDTHDISPGMDFQYTFNTPGTYPYYCVYHPSMVGKVIIKAGAAVTTTSTSTSSSTTSNTPHSTSTTPTTSSAGATSASSSTTSSTIQSTSTTSAAGASSGGLPTTILAGAAAVVAFAAVGFFLLRRRK